MGIARIRYNGKSIPFDKSTDTTLPDGIVKIDVDAMQARIVNTTLTGETEAIILPRKDIHVVVRGRFYHQEELRYQLENWWQWAQMGNPFTFSMDSSEEIYTTTEGSGNVGETFIQVAGVGITTGKYYCLKNGPYYQTVKVTGTIGTGTGSTTVLLDSSLDYPFPFGSVFRSRYYWPAIIRDQNARSPFDTEEAGRLSPLDNDQCFAFLMEFMEDVNAPDTAPGETESVAVNPEEVMAGLPTFFETGFNP